MTREQLLQRKAELEAEYAELVGRVYDVMTERRYTQIRFILASIERQLAKL